MTTTIMTKILTNLFKSLDVSKVSDVNAFFASEAAELFNEIKSTKNVFILTWHDDDEEHIVGVFNTLARAKYKMKLAFSQYYDEDCSALEQGDCGSDFEIYDIYEKDDLCYGHKYSIYKKPLEG